MFFVDAVVEDFGSEPEPELSSLFRSLNPSLRPRPLPEAEVPTTDAQARVFEVDVYSGEVSDFRPGIDRLDFGGQSVHNLILGKTEEGDVAFLSPGMTPRR